MAARTRYTAPASIRFPRHTLERLDRLARKLRVPRSLLIIDAVETLLLDPPTTPPRRPPREEVADVFK